MGPIFSSDDGAGCGCMILVLILLIIGSIAGIISLLLWIF